MQLIIFLSLLTFTTVKMNIIATSGISVVLLSLMPLQSGYPIDILEDDEGLLPTTIPKTTSLAYAATHAPDWDTKLKKSYRECEELTAINVVLVNQFRDGSWKAGPLIKDWAFCVLNKMGLMTMQGVFRYDTALAYIHRDIGYETEEIKKASILINKCLTDKLWSPVDIAWEYLRCHRQKDTKKKYPSLGILSKADLLKKKEVVNYETYNDE